jgi:hypothetical protein
MVRNIETFLQYSAAQIVLFGALTDFQQGCKYLK